MIGLLFGSQNGLDVSIYDAMEVACTAAGADSLELNEALVEKQKDLCESTVHDGISYRRHAYTLQYEYTYTNTNTSIYCTGIDKGRTDLRPKH